MWIRYIVGIVGLLVVLAASFGPLEAGSILFSADTASTADLEVIKADDPDPVLVGATLTYTIVVTNYGPSTSTAELTDTLPASVTFVSATSMAGSCGESEGTVTCSLGVLDSGSSATTTIEVVPTATGTITNTASVTGDVSDPDDENNIAVQDTTVGGADLEVIKAANGAIDRDEMVDTDRDGVVDTTFGDLIAEVEAILVDPDATKSDLNRAKHLAEAVNRHDQVDPATAANETRINHKDRFSREDVHALLHRLLLRFR